MDPIDLPYIATMRSPEGVLFQVAWAKAKDDAPAFPGDTIYGSSRYDPDAPFDLGAAGEIPTVEYVRSGLVVPESVCDHCQVGLPEWFDEGGWPDGQPGVVLGPDGFAVSCEDENVSVQSVGLSLPPEFSISGSPVTSYGTLAGDWNLVPAGYILAGPTSGPPAKPTFKSPAERAAPMLGRLTSGGDYNTHLKKTGIAGNIGISSDLISGISAANIKELQPGMLIEPSGGFPGPVVVIEVDYVGLTITVSEFATSGGAITFAATPITYEWHQQQPGSVTGASADDPTGIVGTQATGPAFNQQGTVIDPGVNQMILVWPRGIANGIQTYEFTLFSHGAANGVNIPGPITTNNVTTGSLTINTTAPAPTIKNTFIINPVTFILTWINNVGTPTPVTLGDGCSHPQLLGQAPAAAGWHVLLDVGSACKLEVDFGLHNTGDPMTDDPVRWRVSVYDFFGQGPQIVWDNIVNPGNFDTTNVTTATWPGSTTGPCSRVVLEILGGTGFEGFYHFEIGQRP